MVRVLIVGAGLTGSLCAHMIRKHFPSKLQCQIVVWEKSTGIGGRMSATRNPANSDISLVELGAQYITPMTKYENTHQNVYKDLTESGILQILQERIEGLQANCENSTNLISTTGLNAIPKYFFAKSLSQVLFHQKLRSLQLQSNETSNWTSWEAINEDGQMDSFDAVIMTIPVPQVIEINKEDKFLSENEVKSLNNVLYSSRYALGLLYGDNKTLPNYCSTYIKPEESNIIRFISFDSMKRGDKKVTTIAVHSSKEFGKSNIKMDKNKVTDILYEEFKKIYPHFANPEHIICHRWKYSQVLKPATSDWGCMEVKSKPLLVLAGDSFTHSNFDGCIESANATTKHFIKWYNEKMPGLNRLA